MPTIDITLNGDPTAVADGSTLHDVVSSMTERALNADGTPSDGGRLGVAAAVDGTVVPRGRWSSRTLEDGQSIDIVTAVQGG